MKHSALTTGILLVAISLIAAAEAQGTLYTQVVTQDCSVDLTAPATRGGGLSNIKVLNHSLWLIGVDVPSGITADDVTSATLTVQWDVVYQERNVDLWQFNHPWSADPTNGSCWNYWANDYIWAGNDPRQTAGLIDSDTLTPGGFFNLAPEVPASTFDVTQAVKNWLNGATNYGFMVQASWGVTQEWEAAFGLSSETAYAPVFQIEYVPEPATMTLLALGVAALLRRKRSR